MKCVDERNKIYSVSLSELTYGKLKELGCGLDNIKLGSLVMFHEREKDIIYIIEGDKYSDTLKYINKALQMGEEQISYLLTQFKTGLASEVFRVMLGVIKQREPELQITATPQNPSNKFISLGNSLVQISKIISVRKYGDTALDVMTTGRNASVRKIYPSREIRDSELRRLEKLLLEIA